MSSPNPIQSRFRPADLGLIVIGAAVFNLLVFGSAAMLQKNVPVNGTMAAYEIQAFLPDEPPPPPERPKPPEKKKPPELEIKPLKIAAQPKERPRLEAPALDFAVNPKLATGLALGPRPLSGYGLSDVDQIPMVTSRVPPMYPYHAKRRGLEGSVNVRFLVDKQGRVSHISIIKADPANVFEEAVRRSLVRWRFKPGQKEGRPVDTWVETSIVFELNQK